MPTRPLHLRAAALVLYCLLVVYPAYTQTSSPPVDDSTATRTMLVLMNGQVETVTLLSYHHGDSIIVRNGAGERVSYRWQDVRRVRMDQPAVVVRSPQLEPEQQTTLPLPPSREPRRYVHEFAGYVPMGSVVTLNQFSGRRGNQVSFGLGGSYHFSRRLGRAHLGVGLDYGLYSRTRNERLGSAGLRGDYYFGNRKVVPFVRADAGAATLIGNLGGRVISRSVDPFFHPALGVTVRSNRSPDRLTFDLGYRFVSTSFRLETTGLELIERQVNYRRLILRLGFQLR